MRGPSYPPAQTRNIIITTNRNLGVVLSSRLGLTVWTVISVNRPSRVLLLTNTHYEAVDNSGKLDIQIIMYGFWYSRYNYFIIFYLLFVPSPFIQSIFRYEREAISRDIYFSLLHKKVVYDPRITTYFVTRNFLLLLHLTVK